MKISIPIGTRGKATEFWDSYKRDFLSNYNFIMINFVNNGNYFRYLDGREELSAVMKFYEERDKEQGKHEIEQENQLKNEGDERE